MSKERQIRGIATKRNEGEGFIVLLDAGDLADWLRQDHLLTVAEQQVVREIADHIEMFAMQVLDGELARKPGWLESS